MKIIYVNCGLIDESEKDLSRNEHYLEGKRKVILSVGGWPQASQVT